MPHGSRSAGLANGPAGVPPRILAGMGNASGVTAPPTGQSFVPYAHDTLAVKSDAAAPGSAVAEARFGPVPTNEVWLVERISIATNSANPTTARVYLGSVDPGNILDATNSGNGDIADQTNPLVVPGGQSLIVRWEGMTDGAVGSARFQFQAGSFQAAPHFGG